MKEQLTSKELDEILEKHSKWLNGKAGGERANLCRADLSEANLSEANLCGADLREANLSKANLSEANLCGADLREANLCGADLREANLSKANLCEADLRGADLDYSCLPLYCGGLHWKVDKRIMAQLAYHFCSMECEDDEVKEAQNDILKLANQFHRAEECGIIKPKEII